MIEIDLKKANQETRDVWDINAAYWDEYMGEGNDFVELLCWPAIERLLDVSEGSRILDIACGNGLTSRRLAKLGFEVEAFAVLSGSSGPDHTNPNPLGEVTVHEELVATLPSRFSARTRRCTTTSPEPGARLLPPACPTATAAGPSLADRHRGAVPRGYASPIRTRVS